MLKEFVESIVKLAKASSEPQLLELPNGKLLLVTDSEVKAIDADRSTHKDLLVSFSSVIDWCNEYDHSDLVIGVSDAAINVAYNRDYAYDSDSAVMKLQHSAAYSDLLDWCKTPRSSRGVVQGLRSKLYETFDPAYLQIFKRLDFTRKNDGSKSVGHTGESLGRSVEMAAQSHAGEIPETLLFNVKLYEGLPVGSFDLRFACTVDPAAEVVAIQPVGDCIIQAHQATRIELVSRLKAECPPAKVLETV